jgi:hypothetical protein
MLQCTTLPALVLLQGCESALGQPAVLAHPCFQVENIEKQFSIATWWFSIAR